MANKPCLASLVLMMSVVSLLDLVFPQLVAGAALRPRGQRHTGAGQPQESAPFKQWNSDGCGTRRFALDSAAVPQLIEQVAAVGDGLSEIQGIGLAMWGRMEPRAPINGVPQYRSVNDAGRPERDFMARFKQTDRELSVVLEFYYNDWAMEFSDTITVQSPRTGKRVPGFVRIKKEHEQDWRNFVKHFISMVPNLKYIQIDNEPENVWVSGKGYERALRLAYEAVQEYNAEHGTDIKVLAAGFYLGTHLVKVPDQVKSHVHMNFPDLDEAWLRRQVPPQASIPAGVSAGRIQFLAQKIHVVMSVLMQKEPAFDILTIHLDGNRPYDTIEEVITWYRNQMKSMGYDRPIWIDDMHSGYYPASGPKASRQDITFTEGIMKGNPRVIARHTREQSAWMTRKVAGYFAAGVERIKIAQLIDNPDFFMPEWRYPGLFTSKFEPKPAYYTTKLLVRKLDCFKTAAKLHDYSYRFTFDHKEDVYLAWSEDGDRNIDLSRELKAPQAKITYLINNVDQRRNPVLRNPTIVPSNRIPLTAEPIFIERVDN